MKTNSLLLVAFLAAASTGAIAAQSSTSQQNLSSQDKTWVKKAHQTNLAEIKLGNMAESKSQNNAVTSMGRTLVSDHSSLDSKLKMAAQNMNINLPSEPSQQQQSMARNLSQKSGSQFDKDWTRKLIAGHRKAIQMTQHEIQNGSSMKVKQLANHTLPILQKHLHQLQSTQTKLGSNS